MRPFYVDIPGPLRPEPYDYSTCSIHGEPEPAIEMHWVNGLFQINLCRQCSFDLEFEGVWYLLRKMTKRSWYWVNAIAIDWIDVGELEAPRWLRQIMLARLCFWGWTGLLLG